MTQQKWMIIILSYLLTLSLACQNHYQFQNIQCTFYFLYPNNNNCDSNFTFQKCNLIGDYQNHTSVDWRTCTDKCCHSDSIYVQNKKGIQKCQEDLNKYYKITLIELYIGTFGGILLIILLSCFLCRWGCCGFCHQYCPSTRGCLNRLCDYLYYLITCQCLRKVPLQPINPAISNEHQYNGNNEVSLNHMQGTEHQREWILSHLNSQKINNECPVCLEQRPSLQLQCGHIFHRSCIIQCIRRKQECIICRSTHFHIVHIYCQQCLVYYYETNLSKYNWNLFKNTQICPSCTQKSDQ